MVDERDALEVLKSIDDKLDTILHPDQEVYPPYIYNSNFGGQNDIENGREFNFTDKNILDASAKYILIKLDADAYITVWINGVEIKMPMVFGANKWYDISEGSIEELRIDLKSKSSAQLQLYATVVPPLGASTGTYQSFSVSGPGVK